MIKNMNRCMHCGTRATRQFCMDTAFGVAKPSVYLHWSCYDMEKGVIGYEEDASAVQCRKSYAFQALRQFHAYIKLYVRQHLGRAYVKHLNVLKPQHIPARTYESDVYTSYLCGDFDSYVRDVVHNISTMAKERIMTIACILNAPMSFRNRPQVKRLKTKQRRLNAPLMNVILPKRCLQHIYDYAFDFKAFRVPHNIIGRLVGTRLHLNEKYANMQHRASLWYSRFTIEDYNKRLRQKKDDFKNTIQKALNRAFESHKTRLTLK